MGSEAPTSRNSLEQGLMNSDKCLIGQEGRYGGEREALSHLSMPLYILHRSRTRYFIGLDFITEISYVQMIRVWLIKCHSLFAHIRLLPKLA